MKRLATFLLSLLVPLAAFSQNWEWEKNTNGKAQFFDIEKDANGNLYVVGEFRDTVTLQGTTIISSGNYDMIIACFDSAGILQWIKTGGGNAGLTSNDRAEAITIDHSGNLFITGFYYGP